MLFSSIQGTMQLQRDFDFIIDYVCSEEARLCLEVRRAVPRLKSVERAVWVVNTLQRTDFSPSNKSEKKNYQKSRRKAQGSFVFVSQNVCRIQLFGQ